MPEKFSEKYTMEDLLSIMATLRSPEGCPWDREQSHTSILNCLVEEAYEFIEAVERDDIENMREELGDLLLQVVFHSQMAVEAGRFGFRDIVQTLSEKLVRRHPHVFGETRIGDSDAVLRQWDEIKQQEKASSASAANSAASHSVSPKTSALEGIPSGLPPLLKAEKIQRKAAKIGFEWKDARGPLAKIREEIAELEKELAEGDKSRIQDEIGDVLFSVVNLARMLKIDSERALSGTNMKFTRRFRLAEAMAKDDGLDFTKLMLEEKDAYWEKAKGQESADAA